MSLTLASWLTMVGISIAVTLVTYWGMCGAVMQHISPPKE